MTLRSQINLLIALLLGLFLAAVVTLEVDATRRSIREEIEASTRITLQLLATVISDAQVRGGDIPPRVLTLFLQHLGRVRANNIKLEDARGQILYVSPPSHYKEGRNAPTWFSGLVTPVVKPFQLRVASGLVTITPDASRSVVDAWDALASLLWLALALFLAVHVLVFWLAGRALAPLSAIGEGLRQMERGEFHARLPRFRVPELDRLAESFNRMAQAVEESFSIRRESARRAEELRENRAIITALIQQHVEEERKALARELHDELGQGVTAVRTIASAIAQRAHERAPDLEANALAIVSVSGQMYDAMHNMVRQLRPIALDNLGLSDALRELAAASHQRKPELSVELELGGALDGLDEVTNITAYRIVQECLTNVARHADADTVTVKVVRDGAEPGLTVTVRDNGRGMDPLAIGEDRMGVRGMRERVSGLGGRFELVSTPGQGVEVRAWLPAHEEVAA